MELWKSWKSIWAMVRPLRWDPLGPDVVGRFSIFIRLRLLARNSPKRIRLPRAHGLELLTIRRPSVRCDGPARFVDQVAEVAGTVVAKLGLGALSVLGWSGGAPYALAAAARVAVSSVQLVSPVPGPLTGPNAIADQSSRLREVATSTLESPWISGPAALRDYLAVASPWPIEPASVEAEVTVWAPDADEIVPPGLLRCLADALLHGELLNVRGDHGWLTRNWSTVLDHC